MKATLLSAIVIVILGSLVGVGVNAVRGRDSISLRRNYFKIAAPVGPKEKPATSEGDDPATEATSEAPKHPFTAATVEDMMDWFESQEYASGQVVFVDARKDEAYEKGHIPGAFQIDNYNVDRDFPLVQPVLEDAEIVVVYCGGGECSDSIYLATELEGLGIARSKIRLFEGGIHEWLDQELPVDEGRE